MRGLSRRGALTVKNGRVQKKNNWELTPNYYSHSQRALVIDRQRPGAGYRHVLMQRDVEKFIALLPDWEEMAVGLNGIVIGPGEEEAFGYHTPGVVHLNAWPDDGEIFYSNDATFLERDKSYLTRLNVPMKVDEKYNGIFAYFNSNQARAFLLLNIFLHELGHHHDRITTESQKRTARGENYAEAYAIRYGDLVWERFTHHFPLD